MALVRYGGGVIQMSGSIAGNTFARNRFGNYTRARTKPVNPNTDWQSRIRAVMAQLTEMWFDDLSVDQRDAWNDYAKAVPMKNKLGETIKLSGFNHFIRSNSGILYARRHTGHVVKDGPTTLTLPEKDVTVYIDVDQTPQALKVYFDIGLDWAKETGGHMFVNMGLPQNKTRNFFAGPWHYVIAIEGAPGGITSPLNWVPYYPVALGQKVWCKFRILQADGRLSEPWQVSALVHAAAPGEGEGEG